MVLVLVQACDTPTASEIEAEGLHVVWQGAVPATIFSADDEGYARSLYARIVNADGVAPGPGPVLTLRVEFRGSAGDRASLRCGAPAIQSGAACDVNERNGTAEIPVLPPAGEWLARACIVSSDGQLVGCAPDRPVTVYGFVLEFLSNSNMAVTLGQQFEVRVSVREIFNRPVNPDRPVRLSIRRDATGVGIGGCSGAGSRCETMSQNGEALFNPTIDETGLFRATVCILGSACANGREIQILVQDRPVSPAIVFTREPSPTETNAAEYLDLLVELRNSLRVRDQNANIPVTLRIAQGPAEGSLIGNVTVQSVNGVARFDRVAVNAPGTYTLQADASGFLTGFTQTFRAEVPFIRLTKHPAEGQIGTVGGEIPILPSVRLQSLDSLPVAGQSVNFRVFRGHLGSPGLLELDVLTGQDGVATVPTWVLDTVPGRTSLVATYDPHVGEDRNHSFFVDILPGPPAALVKVGDNQATAVSTAVPTAPGVIVRDRFGNPVFGFGVTFTALNGSTVTPTFPVLTNHAGEAFTSAWTLGSQGGTQHLRAALGLLSVDFTANATPDASATQLAFTIEPTTTVAQSAISPALRVEVRDAAGNLVNSSTALITIALGANPGGGVLAGTLTRAAVNGIATFDDLRIDRAAAGYTLVASSSGLTNATSNAFTITAGLPAILERIAGEGQTAETSSAVAIAPSVRVTDAQGNPVSGVAIQFAVGLGGGSVTGEVATTNASGIATVGSWTLGAVGQNTLTATAPSLALPPVTFTATATAPAQLATEVRWLPWSGTPWASVPFDPVLQVEIVDDTGARVLGSNATVTLRLMPASPGNVRTGTLIGTLTAIAVNGVASFPGIQITGTGEYSIAAESHGLLSANRSFFITSGGPANIVIEQGDNQTANVNEGVAIPPTVRVTDAEGRGVMGVTVTFSVQTGGGLIDTPVVTTNFNGSAQILGWQLGPNPGLNTLRATVAGLPPVTFTATGN